MTSNLLPTKDIVHSGLNCGNNTWTINNRKLVNKILTCKNGELFESKPFRMAQLLWTIRLYPNGNNLNSKGSVKIFLKLVHMPYILDQIILSYTTTCPVSMASSTALDIYLKSGDSKGWLNRSLLLNEWKKLNLSIIQIIVSVNIFKIKFKKYSINLYNGILSHYRFNQNKTLNTYPKKQKFEYYIDNYTLNKFKQSYYGKRYESVIFNNMWRIRWFPNGANMNCESFMSIYLVLCRIPYTISKITTKYAIICKELNRRISAVDDFSFAASNWGKSKFISLQDIYNKNLKNLTFIVELEILNETHTHTHGDNNNCDIWDEKYINYILSINNQQYELDNHNNEEEEEEEEDKKEIKSLKKRISSKDKMIDQLSHKINNLKSGLKQEINKRNKVIKQLNNKINTIQEYVYNNSLYNDDEKHINNEINIIKKTLKELQLKMDGNIAKKMDESNKKLQLKIWLTNKCELPQYFDNLILNGFDNFESLKDLTKDIMDEIGIDKIGH
eukprot:516201_1